jgi:serine/threonine-protein kinase
MLTAKVPFKGETVSDTLANILQTNPEWQVLPQNTPANIQVLLRRCLTKDPHRRLRDIGDALIEINETLNLPATVPPVTISSAAIPRPVGLRRLIGVIAGLILVAVVTGLVTWSLMRPGPKPVARFPVRMPKNQMLSHNYSHIAVSPDGKRLVYLGGASINRQFFLREVDQVEGKELPGTKDASQPFFSPDGQSIGFFSGGKLKTLFLDGGRPKTLCDAPTFGGGTWCEDDTIFFTPSWTKGLWKISADGGVPEVVTTLDKGELGHFWPEALPGDEAVLFTIWSTSLDDARVAMLSRKTGKWQTLVTGGSHARYAPTGHLLYAQSGTLVAAPFDPKQL